MILVDTSVWIDHLRNTEDKLVTLLESGLVAAHPFVIGELACGYLRNRAHALAALADLPAAPIATHEEALIFLDRHALTGKGIGWVDVHLLASTALDGGAKLWTRDKRLADVAVNLGLAYSDGAEH